MHNPKIISEGQPVPDILRIFANITIISIGVISAAAAYIFLNAVVENPNIIAKIIAGCFSITFILFTLTFFFKLIPKNQ